jgi:hypothetical protein
MTYTRNDKRLEAVAGVDSDSDGAKLWLARYDAIRAFDDRKADLYDGSPEPGFMSGMPPALTTAPAVSLTLTLREEPRPPFVVDSEDAMGHCADCPTFDQCSQLGCIKTRRQRATAPAERNPRPSRAHGAEMTEPTDRDLKLLVRCKYSDGGLNTRLVLQAFALCRREAFEECAKLAEENARYISGMDDRVELASRFGMLAAKFRALAEPAKP